MAGIEPTLSRSQDWTGQGGVSPLHITGGALWQGLDLAGLVGPDTLGLCRRAFEGEKGARNSIPRIEQEPLPCGPIGA